MAAPQGWSRWYDDAPDHPKFVAAGHRAGWLYVCGQAYASTHETDGRIPKSVVPRLTDVPSPMRVAAKLVEVGLWHDRGDHFEQHDYCEMQTTAAEREAARAEARERKRRERERRAAQQAKQDPARDAPPPDDEDDVTPDVTRDRQRDSERTSRVTGTGRHADVLAGARAEGELEGEREDPTTPPAPPNGFPPPPGEKDQLRQLIRRRVIDELPPRVRRRMDAESAKARARLDAALERATTAEVRPIPMREVVWNTPSSLDSASVGSPAKVLADRIERYVDEVSDARA